MASNSLVETSNSSHNAAVTPSTNSNTPQSKPMALSIQIACLDCLFLLMECVFGSVIFTAVIRFILSFTLTDLFSPETNDIIYSCAGSMAITAWLVARFATNTKISFQAAFELVFLHNRINNTSKTLSDDIVEPRKRMKRIVIALIICQIASMGILYILQHFTDSWIYSLDNFNIPITSTITHIIPISSTTVSDVITSSTPSSLNDTVIAPLINTAHDIITNNATIDTIATATVDTATEATESITETIIHGYIFSPLKCLQLLLLAPLSEEVIFRCICLAYVHARLVQAYPQPSTLTDTQKPKKIKKIKVPRPQQQYDDDNSSDNNNKNQIKVKNKKLVVVNQDGQEIGDISSHQNKTIKLPKLNIAQLSSLVTGIVFGIIHIVNITNDQYSKEYICLQIIVATLTGIVYNTLFYHYGLIMPFIIHVINNISASLISTSFDSLYERYPILIVFGYGETVIAYFIFAILCIVYGLGTITTTTTSPVVNGDTSNNNNTNNTVKSSFSFTPQSLLVDVWYNNVIYSSAKKDEEGQFPYTCVVYEKGSKSD